MADERPAWLDHPRAQNILAAVRPIAGSFREAGHTLYLVGGVVRDLSQGADGTVVDLDLTTDAPPETIRRLLVPLAQELWTQGERFGTIGAVVDGWACEITTHRGESYSTDSRKPEVVFGTDLTTDLSRRDFTINAMAIDTSNGELIDPFRGAEDLENRLLRTPLDPSISFTDDPLRILRAARFIPRFALAVDPALREAAVAHRDRLSIVSRERVHDEFERLLSGRAPEAGFEFLIEVGLLAKIAPDIDPMKASTIGRSVARATAPVARRAVFAAQLPDAGDWLHHLRYSTADRQATLRLVAGIELIADVARSEDEDGMRLVEDRSVRQLAATVGFTDLPLVFDAAGALGHDLEVWMRRVDHLGKHEDLSNLRSPLGGGAVVEALGIEPGPLVGEAVQMLTQARLDRGPLEDDEALQLLREWFESIQDPTRGD